MKLTYVDRIKAGDKYICRHWECYDRARLVPASMIGRTVESVNQNDFSPGCEADFYRPEEKDLDAVSGPCLSRRDDGQTPSVSTPFAARPDDSSTERTSIPQSSDGRTGIAEGATPLKKDADALPSHTSPSAGPVIESSPPQPLCAEQKTLEQFIKDSMYEYGMSFDDPNLASVAILARDWASEAIRRHEAGKAADYHVHTVDPDAPAQPTEKVCPECKGSGFFPASGFKCPVCLGVGSYSLEQGKEGLR